MSKFGDSIEHYCKGYTVAPGCRGIECEYAEGDEEHRCEASFSSAQCDSCGSTFAGDREPATMIPLDYKAGEDTMIDVTICVDCVMAWANGDDPDEPWYRTPQDYRNAEEARQYGDK